MAFCWFVYVFQGFLWRFMVFKVSFGVLWFSSFSSIFTWFFMIHWLNQITLNKKRRELNQWLLEGLEYWHLWRLPLGFLGCLSEILNGCSCFFSEIFKGFSCFFYNFCFNQWLAESLQYWPLVRSEGLAYVRTPPWDSLTGLPIHLI